MSNTEEEKGILDEIYERYLECPICTEDYDGDIHIPRLLPCQHTYCTHCLRRLSNNAGHVTCAQCKAVSKDVPTIDKYPKDLTRCDLLDFVRSKSRCDLCKTKKAEFICTTCPSKLCKNCKGKTHETRPYLHHNVQSLLKENNSLDGKCNKDGHENGLLKLYCEECQQVVCATCTFLDHRNSSFHTVTTLKMAFERILHTATNIELNMSEEIHLIHFKYYCILQKLQGRQIEKDGWKNLYNSPYVERGMPRRLKIELRKFCNHVCNTHINLLKDKKDECEKLLEQLQNCKKIVTRRRNTETDVLTFMSSRKPMSSIRRAEDNFYQILAKTRRVLERQEEFDVHTVKKGWWMSYMHSRFNPYAPQTIGRLLNEPTRRDPKYSEYFLMSVAVIIALLCFIYKNFEETV